MNTIFGNFLERTIPNLRDAIINLTIGGNSSVMNLEDFKAVMAPEPTPIPEPSYKVYTALVTQSGTDDPISINTGLLTIGVTYVINNDSPGMDFTNVGAPNNETGTSFVATGTLPNSWGAEEGDENILQFNTGAPVVSVLENTIGNIWCTYASAGTYSVNSNGLFTLNKTWTYPNNIQSMPTDGGSFISIQFSSSNSILLESSNDDIISYGGNPLRLEIRVYN
jgi:hypothetical protein